VLSCQPLAFRHQRAQSSTSLFCSRAATRFSSSEISIALLIFSSVWGERGYFFVDGPSGAAGHRSNARGEDGLAFRPSSEDLLILDNRSWARRGNVGSATAIDPTVNLGQNLDAMIAKVQNVNVPEPHRSRILTLLR